MSGDDFKTNAWTMQQHRINQRETERKKLNFTGYNNLVEKEKNDKHQLFGHTK